MSSDAEVVGCSMIWLELGSRGPGYPGCFARPWLEWSVARGASVSFGSWGLSRARVLRATRPGQLRNNPRQVAAGGDVTRCRSGQAEPAVDGTSVRKGVTGGARAPRALSLWNALGARLVFWPASRLTRVDGALRAFSLWNAMVRGGSSGILVGYPAHTGRRGTPARRRGPIAD
ncbi:hypothetical protein TIFTF001_056276 [Ficus carica]|uniref:Uncharacterized protein n=1 Tax=Ficus carica TaxID=3494 RepID=A0AA88EKJ4_FICCA|nr:hypothetical protein TIFTF001_056276 [Ficus carica]